MTVKAEGYTYDRRTGDWTERVEYTARDRMEAIRWMNMNRDWMKHLRIVEPMTDNAKAYQEGYVAYHPWRMPVPVNPYNPRSPMATAWQQGFDQAEGE